jgi:hypothetical protein
MKPKDKHVCALCHKHRSVYQYRGRVQADRHHTLCFQCYRACCNQLRERARAILAGMVLCSRAA